jgi:hypothetical protein
METVPNPPTIYCQVLSVDKLSVVNFTEQVKTDYWKLEVNDGKAPFKCLIEQTLLGGKPVYVHQVLKLVNYSYQYSESRMLVSHLDVVAYLSRPIKLLKPFVLPAINLSDQEQYHFPTDPQLWMASPK